MTSFFDIFSRRAASAAAEALPAPGTVQDTAGRHAFRRWPGAACQRGRLPDAAGFDAAVIADPVRGR